MKNKKEIINMTYFNKLKEIDINDSLGKVVYLEVDSPLNYGQLIWSFYGKIVNITKCYFEIIQYCEGYLNNWRTDQILLAESKQLKKKWAKKSIQKLIEVKIEEKDEKIKYYSN